MPATIQIGTGTASSRFLKTKFPNLVGLLAGVSTQNGTDISLHAQGNALEQPSDLSYLAYDQQGINTGEGGMYLNNSGIAYTGLPWQDPTLQYMADNYITVATSGNANYTGTTDAAIQLGINAAVASGQPLLIQNGTYTITKSLVINGNILMVGNGMLCTILSAVSGLNDSIIKINSTQSNNAYYVTLQDFQLIHNSASQSAGDCITAYGCVESNFVRLHLGDPYAYGINLLGLQGNSGGSGHNNRILQCLFDPSSNANGSVFRGTGVNMKNNDENIMMQCECQYLTMGVLDNAGFSRFVGNSFVNCATGAQIMDSSRSGFNNCVFDKCTGVGLWLKGAFNVVNGCTFYDCSHGNSGANPALLIDWYGSNNITGNVFLSDVAGETTYGLKDNGTTIVNNNTTGHNLITNNSFISMAGATTLSTSNWATAAYLANSTANTNLGATNYAITSAGASSITL